MPFGDYLHSGGLAQRDVQRFGDTRAICRVGLRAMADVAQLHRARRGADRAGGIGEQRLPLRRAPQAEPRTGLRKVIGVDALVPVVDAARKVERGLPVIGLLGPFAVLVGLAAERAAENAVDPHRAVPVVAVHRAARSVHRNWL
jgi:hypothetical protein